MDINMFLKNKTQSLTDEKMDSLEKIINNVNHNSFFNEYSDVYLILSDIINNFLYKNNTRKYCLEMYDYYKGNHNIKKKGYKNFIKGTDGSGYDAVVENKIDLIVDQYLSFVFNPTEGLRYNIKTDKELELLLLENNQDIDFRVRVKDMAKKSLINGVAYSLLDINRKVNKKDVNSKYYMPVKVLDTSEVIIINNGNSIYREINGAIIVNFEKNSLTNIIEFYLYTRNNLYKFGFSDKNEKGFTLITKESHNFNKVPIGMMLLNDEGSSIIEKYISKQDELNYLATLKKDYNENSGRNFTNIKGDYDAKGLKGIINSKKSEIRDSILEKKGKNYVLTKQELIDMEEEARKYAKYINAKNFNKEIEDYGVINTPSDVSLEFLTLDNTFNYDNVKISYDDAVKFFHDIIAAFNTEVNSNVSGRALEWQYYNLLGSTAYNLQESASSFTLFYFKFIINYWNDFYNHSFDVKEIDSLSYEPYIPGKAIEVSQKLLIDSQLENSLGVRLKSFETYQKELGLSSKNEKEKIEKESNEIVFTGNQSKIVFSEEIDEKVDKKIDKEIEGDLNE